jgi:hypothetical protein
MDEQAAADVIAGLTGSDFDKSMPSELDHSQDVYKPIVGGRSRYVKFTVDTRSDLLLISFKDNEP